MRLVSTRVQKYRSIRDTGNFDIEWSKTILVGPNEAGKTAVLEALQQINAPDGVAGFKVLRDYPRALYSEDVASESVDPAQVVVTTAEFGLDDGDKAEINESFHDCTYVYKRLLDNSAQHTLKGGPEVPTYQSVRKDFVALAKHADKQHKDSENKDDPSPSESLKELSGGWTSLVRLRGETNDALQKWLDDTYEYVDESVASAEKRFNSLQEKLNINNHTDETLKILSGRRPVFVLFTNYHRVRPIIHLDHLATRLESGAYDDEQYDYGNECLLKLLNFTARELSDLGKVTDPAAHSAEEVSKYREKLDERQYLLNAASVRLTNEIRKVWNPNPDKAEADKLRIIPDGQYLKVVVEDELGVEVELDQRSEGFQWLVSFFIVFFAEALDKHENAILLLDEPGLSLHGLKQREFRKTISRLAKENQVIYTTHSPFLVGSDELNIVRVVEMTDRSVGTKVHTHVTANDPAALLPLQEALGYDLAQSLFMTKRNLVLEGLTDYWYVESIAELLRESGDINLNEKIALIPAKGAGKVVYYATILHANNLKVAALLDSDSAGNQAAKQEVLVNTLGNKNILRTKDAYAGDVAKPEIEDLIRDTLVAVAKDDLGWDVTTKAKSQSKRGIIDIFSKEIKDFSKYKLSKAFLRWTSAHETSDLQSDEVTQWKKLLGLINSALH